MSSALSGSEGPHEGRVKDSTDVLLSAETPSMKAAVSRRMSVSSRTAAKRTV
jgi:hypothetical protein